MILRREMAELIRAESKNYTCKVYAKRLGVSWEALRRFASLNKIQFLREQCRREASEYIKLREDVVQCCQKGLTITETENHLNVSRHFVKTWWPGMQDKPVITNHKPKRNPWAGVDFSQHEVKSPPRQALPTRFRAPDTQTKTGNGTAMCAGV